MPDSFKIALRNTIKQVRSKMPYSYTAKSSLQICNRIRALEQYRHAKRIALYHAANGEVDLGTIWSSAPLHGKFCYFPKLHTNNTLLFLPATPATHFIKNHYGISEPDVDPNLAIDPNDLDLILMPLVAFDAKCTRIGMGAGYYDKTLADKDACTLFGVAYQFQRVDFIEAQEWDIPLDAVITNRAIYWREAKI